MLGGHSNTLSTTFWEIHDHKITADGSEIYKELQNAWLPASRCIFCVAILPTFECTMAQSVMSKANDLKVIEARYQNRWDVHMTMVRTLNEID